MSYTPCCFLLILCFVKAEVATAQLTFSGQVRTRTEIRNGLGNLALKSSKPSGFTSQRTRVSIGYKWDRLKLGLTMQDIRVWGQDASGISNADGNKLMLHEGWAELVLLNKADSLIKAKGIDYLGLKLGRQELVYDDSRLIGNLDWLQQGRRHDMALLKTVHKGWQIDLGYAYNQNSDAFGTSNSAYLPANVPAFVMNSAGSLVPVPFGLLPIAPAGNAANNSSKTGMPVWTNPPNSNAGNQQYKSFTSLYISKKIKQANFSGLFFNDNFGKYKIDSVGSQDEGYVYGKRFVESGASDSFDYSGTHSRYTYGLMLNQSLGNSPVLGKISMQLAWYKQGGKSRDGVKMKKACHLTAALTWQKGRLSITPGYDILSGNDPETPTDEKFDPLYGTPHRHWGYMDYFYAGTGSPAGGLRNPYLKFKYTLENFNAGVDLHVFSMDESMRTAVGARLDKCLGRELDLVLNYTMNRFTNLELGGSLLKTTRSMALAKGQAAGYEAADNYRRTAGWTYLALKFTPDFLYSGPVAPGQRAPSKPPFIQ
jgi:hypothetical protein